MWGISKKTLKRKAKKLIKLSDNNKKLLCELNTNSETNPCASSLISNLTISQHNNILQNEDVDECLETQSETNC